MTEWVKRLQGYVKIRVWGFAPQRFINLCSNKGILLWNIEKQEDVYTMCIGLRSFLRTAAHRQKDKSKGSHIGKIWTTLLCRNAAQKSVSGRFISGGGFLADFVFICVGYSGDWQLSGDG